ncbi:hypothetical protein FACS189454_01700 [Planctomycetales bacterium]|nr:hypothetical protein FACS189454_01700 [Planctomycetales bacterium]
MNDEIQIIVSDILKEELEKAYTRVRDFFFQLKKSDIEFVTSSEQSNGLATQYIAEGIVTGNFSPSSFSKFLQVVL